MARLPWTKFQDFYLRLGFLKVLVAALSPQRRSATNDQVVRRLQTPLFDGLPRHPELVRRVETRITGYPRRTAAGKTIEYPEIAEALLIDGEAASLLYAITRDTAYKILDWARDVEFVGQGNQITERALLLRQLMSEKAIDSFFAGDLSSWNPFVLTTAERLLFLYHLVEIDRVTVELIDDLAKLEPGTVLASSDAAKLTCHALFRVLDEARDKIEPRDLPAYRVARELACTIATEVGLVEYAESCSGVSNRRIPKPPKVGGRQGGGSFAGRVAGSVRKTTKNADHQTIPRFEQLVDLGFLSKSVDDGRGGASHDLAGRKRWRYIPTDACRRWRDARPESADTLHFRWTGFARAAVNAYATHEAGAQVHGEKRLAASYLWRAYNAVGRAMGPTPVDSVALFATILAVTDGRAIEMVAFHEILLELKQKSLLPDHAHFSSGNDMESMFVLLKPGFLEQLEATGLLNTHLGS